MKMNRQVFRIGLLRNRYLIVAILIDFRLIWEFLTNKEQALSIYTFRLFLFFYS